MIMRIFQELINNYFIYILSFLLQTWLVNTLCGSYPSLRCCPDSVWDEGSNKCVGCQTGYLGPKCAKMCSPPNYGKRCQFKCTCRGAETCHPSFGCVIPTTTTTTIYVKTTTEVNEENTIDTETTSADVGTTLLKNGISATSKVAISTSSIISQKREFQETNYLLNNKFYMHNSVLLGIFMLWGLFVVLFAAFVGKQIRNKFFKRHNFTTQSTHGLYLKPCNFRNADQSLEPNIFSQAEEASGQNRTLPKYIEVIEPLRNSTCVSANNFTTT